MSTQPKMKRDELGSLGPEPLLTRDEFVALAGLILVALGVVFAFAQANVIDYGSPWWTLFIGIPGLVFIGAAVVTYRHQGHVTPMAITQAVIGLMGVALALIFIVDPTWSFTRNWTLFQGTFWDTLWRWALVAVGALVVAVGLMRQGLPTVILGGAIAAVGLVFVLNISWNVVWPFAIIAAGLYILAQLVFRREA